MCVALEWPDTTLVLRAVFGFPVVGEIERTSVFRECIHEPEVSPVQELLSDAEQFVDDLEAKGKPAKDPEHDVQCLRLSQKDIDKGSATGFFRREQIDQVFGVGKWRPVPRHVIFQQHNGK